MAGEGPDGLSYRWQGIDTLRATMTAAARSLDDLSDAGRNTAGIVGSVASSRAPKRTGRLAGSRREVTDALTTAVTFGSEAVPYAPPIHWGWAARGIRPQPFAWDAVNQTEARWVREYELACTKRLAVIRGA